ncbi:hypothetical protein ACJ41O_008910 [Fusarium nematophilum]
MASWRRGGLQNHRRLGQRNGLDKESDNSHKKSCVYFRKGNCTYGSKCKFSHDTADAAGGSRPCPPDPDPDPEARERYYEWKSLIRRDRSRFHAFHTGNTSVQDALELWDGALAILDGDGKEHHQFLARDLVDDDFNGQRYITDTCKTALSAEMSVRCVESFLKVATHPALLDCLSIDTYVGTLYAMFGGPNGERGIDLLNRMCGKGLVKLGLFEESPGSDSLGVVDVTLKALYELLNRVPRAQFCDSLPALLESLEDVLGRLARDNSGAKLDALKSRLGIVKRVVSGAAGRIATEPSPEDGDAEQQTLSSFPRDVETPGGRHDNDFADISGISILPTYGEIMSDKPEYLPTTNFHHPHVLADPMQRHIDSMFRLVRHDTFDPINAVLSDVLASEDLSKARLSNRDSQAQIYSPANIRRISIDRRHGIEAIVSFINPPHIRKKTPSEQRSWWQASSRLDEGTLVCFVSMQDLLFLQVTAKNTEASEKPDPSKSTLVSSDFPPSITVKLANSPLRRSDLSLLVQLLSGKVSGVLVDFHGVIPDTFVPILKNLQKIKRENHIAFQTWILPGSSRAGSIPPPLYARKAGFFFPLGCISKNASSNLRLDPSEPPVDLKELERETGLDHGQCQGLIAALTREYALIQGPPGTGKSYLGVQLVRVLLAIKRQAKLGPILVICYTNHALDQFLKHLLGVGISKIIRIGGRSVTPELSGKNLRVVSRETLKTRLEGQILGQAYGELEKSMNMAGDAMRPLLHARKGPSWAGLQQFLARKHHEIYRQLKLEHDDGYKTVSKDPLVAWLGQRPPNTAGLPREGGLRRLARQAQEDMESLTNAERWTLVDSWLEQQHESQVDIVFESLDESEHQRRIINRTHEAVDQRTVIQADVVGITTTSLARNIVMLRRVKPKVVICEEAAEVQEAHIISALMPGVEHLIQIGDHRQLRPQINSFSLSLESSSGKMWQLDRSQFERRAVGEPGLRPAPFAQLDVQRRMRPDISRLIRRVYPHLQDHDSVVDLPDVVGMQRNLFWLDHNHVEDSGGDGNIKSHSNIWETNMATALVRHLVRQGEYKTEDIALLTPYTGQLQQLRAALSKDFEICLSDRDMEKLAHEGFEDVPADDGAQKNAVVEKKQLLQTIRLATVDNFQGEEAKVIVVSLVRSNTQRKVGFLRTENRINVLLSRAQHGMYLIGNSETYLNVPMWEDVHAQLAQAGSECSDKGDARVDLLEFRSYAEVDLHKSPIVVLGCGHFFTGETLDGLVGLDEVYTRGKDGAFDGLKNVSSSLARNVPFCPDCKRPIRQFASKRYNRLINRAVMDEICKRFIIKGREDLTRVERFLQGLADDLDKSRPSAAGSGLITFAERYDKVKKLENIAKALRKRLGEEHQPVRMLVDAIAVSRVQAAGDTLSITRQMEALKLAAPAPDKQLVLRAQLVVFKAREVQLRDGFAVAKIWKGTPLGDLVKAWSTNSALPSKGTFLRDSEELVKQAREANLPRIAIAATLAFAGVAWLIACHGKSVSTEAGSASLSEEKNIENVADRTEDALAMLNNALPLCSKLGNSDELRESLEGMIRLFEPRYEDVTAEELASIKSAMVSGSGGIATHSGHWYNCVNGHPFAIGECGMPMEVARCPECGAPIGGTQHQALEGVSRAEDMERA